MVKLFTHGDPLDDHRARLDVATRSNASSPADGPVAEGREDEVEEIRRDISRLAPDLSKTSTNEENSGLGQAQPPLREA